MIYKLWTHVLILIVLVGTCLTMYQIGKLKCDINQLQISFDYAEQPWHEMEQKITP